MWYYCCSTRCRVGYRIWPPTCFEFDRPALNAIHTSLKIVLYAQSNTQGPYGRCGCGRATSHC
jgi:hypothetical protein